MLLELYIIFQIAALTSFFLAFFFRHEILWLVTFVLSGFLMLNSFNVETIMMQATNTQFGAGIVDVSVSHSYPYLMGINLLFFALALFLGLYDMFDKYGQSLAESKATTDEPIFIESPKEKIKATVNLSKKLKDVKIPDSSTFVSGTIIKNKRGRPRKDSKK